MGKIYVLKLAILIKSIFDMTKNIFWQTFMY